MIFLDVPKDILINRVIERIQCDNCGKIYNINNKPKNENICDCCHSYLKKRSDDNINSIKRRIQIFDNESKEIIEYYKNKGILKVIDGNMEVEEIIKDIF